MSLFNCIETAVSAGEMDGGRAAVLQDLVRKLESRYAHLGPEAAAAQAAADAKRILRESTARRRRLALKQIQTARRLEENITGYRNNAGEADAGDALVGLLEWDQMAGYESVGQIRGALRGRYHRMITDFLRQHGRNVIGQVRQKARLPNIVRELFGEGTGDASARELAQAVGNALEQARLDFNAAGGDIGKLDGWGLPQSHDADRIRSGGFAAWRAAIEPELDWNRIVDFETDLPFEMGPSDRKDAFLKAIFDDIVTDGWAKMVPKFTNQGRSMANRRADHRVLHFRNADSWMRYNQQFGRDGAFEAIVTHLDGLARDTALMRVLGPSPAAGLEFAIQVAKKQAETKGWKLGPFNRLAFRGGAPAKVDGRGLLAKNMLAQLMGETSRPAADRAGMWLAGFRHLQVSAKLGGAMLSAVSDLGFQAMAARHLGMSAGKVIARQARMLASSGERMTALRAGVIADELANVGVAQARFTGEAYGPAIAERLSEATMRLSGLTRWTEAGRHAFQLEMMGFLADHAGRQWDELPDPLRRLFFEARGFGAREWDIIRSTKLHEDPSGATFLVPDDIRHRTDIAPEEADGLALRLMGAIHEQMEFAVPSGSLRGRAIALQSTRPGTFVGELLRSGLMFKNFALSIVFNQLRRQMFAQVNGSRAANIAAFFTMTTLMGAASVQLKEVAKGRDPRDMTTAKFAGAAIAQGGGLGILGDFFADAQSRFGSSVANTLTGPVLGAAFDAGAFANDTYTALRDGKDTKAGRKIVRGIQQQTPLQSLWWANLALRRHVFENLQRALDPEADAAFRRAERRRIKAYGNDAWWAPGQPAPDRAPDLSSAFGGQ